MNIAQLKKSVSIKRPRKKIVGRGEGSGHGKTSGRGHKGQKSRSGFSRKPFFEGGQMSLIRKTPKRGFTRGLFKKNIAIVNVETLNKFPENELINLESLRELGLVKGLVDELKILGKGELTKAKLKVQAHRFSKGAIEKIQQQGGQVIFLKELNKQTKPKPDKTIPPTATQS